MKSEEFHKYVSVARPLRLKVSRFGSEELYNDSSALKPSVRLESGVKIRNWVLRVLS